MQLKAGASRRARGAWIPWQRALERDTASQRVHMKGRAALAPPIPQDAKTYVCCDLTTALHNVWVPWTAAGVLALVLSVCASLRVVTSTLRPHGQKRRSGSGGTEGGMNPVDVVSIGSKGQLSPAATS